MDGAALPQRRCVACRASLPKGSMLRLVVDESGQIWPDLLQQLPGRGAYICMQPLCLERLDDRRLQPLNAKFSVAWPQWGLLKGRMNMVLDKQLRQIFAQQRIRAEIGRDAVMHRLWNNAPLLLLLAADAGEALVRQLDDALEKRSRAGHQTLRISAPSKLWLGEMLNREEVAIAGLPLDQRSLALTDRLVRFCGWNGYLR